VEAPKVEYGADMWDTSDEDESEEEARTWGRIVFLI
jgi:hypothetical protein